MVAREVKGAPWRIVLRVPTAVLYEPVAGMNQLPWIMFTVLALALLGGVMLLARLAHHRSALSILASQDALTGLYNRRFITDRLARERRSASGEVATVLMVDADNFKHINDQFGHERGDEVLQVIAQRLRSCLRSNDVVARWGGEEFLVVLPGTGPEEGAHVAERIRAAVEAAQSPPVTVSVGCASGRLSEALIKEADGHLYDAKEAGRNRVGRTSPRPADRADQSETTTSPLM